MELKGFRISKFGDQSSFRVVIGFLTLLAQHLLIYTSVKDVYKRLPITVSIYQKTQIR